MPGFQSFLDTNSVSDIPVEFSEVMDAVATPALTTALAVPTPIIAGVLSAIVAPALVARTGAALSDAAGATALMVLIETDVQALIASQLAAGTVNLASPKASGVPGASVSPAALASGPAADQPGFGVAVLQWTISLIPPSDPRLISPITA